MNPIRPPFTWSTSLQVSDLDAAVLLVRHAETDASGEKISGRMPGIHLNARGRAETRALDARLARLPIAAVYSSPLERAIETARPIASARGLDVLIEESLNEIDFGEWTGLTFAALDSRDDWRRYNADRAHARIPDGESPADTARRVVCAIEKLSERHPNRLVVAVTHAELIRYARLHVDGRSLREWHTVNVATASVTAIVGAVA